MGPISMDWIKKHGEHWAGGRIDIYGPWAYPQEYALPIMHREDFVRFGQWLESQVMKLQLARIKKEEFNISNKLEMSFHPNNRKQKLFASFFEGQQLHYRKTE